MVLFSARSIDEFITQGKAAPAYDLRMTDLSDGVVFVGFMSQKKPLKNISTNSVQLRSDDGKNFLNITDGTITAQAENEITLQVGQCQLQVTSSGVKVNKPVEIDASLTVKSDTTINGSVTANGDVVANGISLDNHTHGGVKSGSDSTGAPQ